jgi:hypothetical protein
MIPLALPSLAASDKKPGAKEEAEKLKQKLNERNQVAKEVLEIQTIVFQVGSPPVENYLLRVPPAMALNTQHLVFAAALELADNEADKIAVHKENLEMMKKVEEVADVLVKTGRGTVTTRNTVIAERPQAEIQLDLAQCHSEPNLEAAARIKELKKQKARVLQDNADFAMKILETPGPGGAKGEYRMPIEPFRALLAAQLEIKDKPEDRIRLIEAYEELIKECRAKDDALLKEGKENHLQVELRKAEYLQDKIAMLRERAKIKPGGNETAEVKKMLEERRDCLREMTKHISKVIEDAKDPLLAVGQYTVLFYRPFEFLLETELELTTKESDRLALYEKNVEQRKKTEEMFKAMAKFGKSNSSELSWAAARRLDGEIALIRAKIGHQGQRGLKETVPLFCDFLSE